MNPAIWKPKRVPRKTNKEVVRKQTTHAQVEVEKKEDVPVLVKPSNPFEHYEQNESISLRVKRELDQLSAMYQRRFQLVCKLNLF